MKMYDLVKDLLTKYPDLRDSDRKLIWAVCWKKQLIQVNEEKMLSRMLYMNFLQAPSFESITRARRKVQELHPELQSRQAVFEVRQDKEEKKGNFVFHEEVKGLKKDDV